MFDRRRGGIMIRSAMFAAALVLFVPAAGRADTSAEKKPATATKTATVEAKVDADLFRSDAARIEMKKPKGWRFSTVESALANRANVKMKDEEFQKALESSGATPIMVVMKHEEPYDKLNPAIQMIVRGAGPLEGKSGVEILTLVEPVLKSQFENCTTVDTVRATTVGGQTGARMTLRYTLKTPDGREFPTQSTIVMIPRGKVLYQIGFSGPPEGDDAVAAVIDPALASVKFLE
jgi:hypothetical protein